MEHVDAVAMTWLLDALGANTYWAHSICLTNDPVLINLYVVFDLSTWLSYMVIGITLFVRRTMIFIMTPAVLVLYGSFIFWCGMSHLTKVLVLFTGAYRLDILIVTIMAGVSIATALLTLANPNLFSPRDYVRQQTSR